MATRSVIAKQLKENEYKVVYCHWDGYPEGVGACLIEYYNTPEKVDALLDLGDISSLHSKLEPTKGSKHSFDTPEDDVTVAYGRDRGEQNVEAQIFNSINKIKDCYDCNYIYIFTLDNKWKFVYAYDPTNTLYGLNEYLSNKKEIKEGLKEGLKDIGFNALDDDAPELSDTAVTELINAIAAGTVDVYEVLAAFENLPNWQKDVVVSRLFDAAKEAMGQTKRWDKKHNLLTTQAKKLMHQEVNKLTGMNKDQEVEEKLEIHEVLNPILFDTNNLIKEEIRTKLIEIANDFISTITEDEDGMIFPLKDIILVGSNVSYNYTKNSDVDLHLIVDSSELEEDKINLYSLIYNIYKGNYNKDHEITVKKIPVELYVEMDETKVESNGVYDLTNNEWIKKPNKIGVAEDKMVDDEEFEKEFTKWEDKYFNLISSVEDKVEEEISEGLEAANICAFKHKSHTEKLNTNRHNKYKKLYEQTLNKKPSLSLKDTNEYYFLEGDEYDEVKPSTEVLYDVVYKYWQEDEMIEDCESETSVKIFINSLDKSNLEYAIGREIHTNWDKEEEIKEICHYDGEDIDL